jgi:hypothetical protein
MNPTRDLNTDRAATLTEYLNNAVGNAVTFDWWPEMMEVELRQFRPNYTPGEFLEATNERYHPGSGKYYQALQLQVAATEAPATYSAGVWTENSAYWAETQGSYTADDQVDGEALAVGDQRRDPNTGLFYQIFTAHTAVDTSVDTTKAGVLTAFARTIDYDQTGETPMGEVKAVHRRDPRVFPDRSGKLNQRKTSAGLLVLPGMYNPQYLPQSTVPNQVWVEFRRRPPVFTSTPWVSGTAYDRDALVYYRGDTFKSAHGNNDAAVDGAVNWILVEFPEIFAAYVKFAAAADCSTDQKQDSRSTTLRQQAEAELERVRDQEINSQQDPETAEVSTYGT